MQSLPDNKKEKELIVSQKLPQKNMYLENLALNGKKFFLQFGGQGNSFLNECSRLYLNYPELKEFFEIAFQTINDEMKSPHFSQSEYFSFGFDLKKWLNSENLPPLSYLNSCPISLASIHITQMAYFHLLVLRSAITEKVFQNSIGITGHSQGIHSACLASLMLQGNSFFEAFQKFIQYYLYSGLVCQKNFPPRNLPDELLAISENLDRSPPSPMAVVSGLDRNTIETLLADFHLDNHIVPEITISLENTYSIFVLSGKPKDLLQFRITYFDFFKSKNISWNYLEISAPFHSHFMENGLHQFKKDLEKIQFHYSGSDLKIPVFDTYTGKNLQEISFLGEHLFELQVNHPLIWKNAIMSLLDNPTVTHVIDFGPGKSSSFFTQEILKNTKLEILTVVGRRGLNQLLGT